MNQVIHGDSLDVLRQMERRDRRRSRLKTA